MERMRIFFFVLFIYSAAGCSYKVRINSPKYPASRKMASPDYSDLYYWAAHPWKKNPSDSMPLPLREDPKDTAADVFFIHPTTYTETKKGWNADLNDSDLNAKTDYS